jgi:hypothetical protein
MKIKTKIIKITKKIKVEIRKKKGEIVKEIREDKLTY